MSKKIIVALDNNNFKEIKELVKILKNEVYAFKLGYEFFFNFGIDGYKIIQKISPNIFLDLKLHDIPNTVSKAIKAINNLEPILTTIHISGGDDMMKSSLLFKKKTKILGVSVLTSLDKIQTKKYYREENIQKLVTKFAKYSKKNKLDGIVCSPQEIKYIRKEVGKKFLIVTPGIRLDKNLQKNDDQKRFLSPIKAIERGANLLVIGRPITNSVNPLETLLQINKSLT